MAEVKVCPCVLVFVCGSKVLLSITRYVLLSGGGLYCIGANSCGFCVSATPFGGEGWLAPRIAALSVSSFKLSLSLNECCCSAIGNS